MSKKVILFIVEGLSEQNALYPIISEILDQQSIYFEITYGDITSNYTEQTASNIIDKISEIINSYLSKRNFKVDDLHEVILLTDTDGTFIKSQNIEYHGEDTVIYEDNRILTKNIMAIQMRNTIKSQILNKLFNLESIVIRSVKVPFKTFYMSCNLDHVIHNERNMIGSKLDKANMFADSFDGREEEFIPLLKEFMSHEKHSFLESWEHITKSNHSLLRYSNLWLYFNPYK